MPVAKNKNPAAIIEGVCAGPGMLESLLPHNHGLTLSAAFERTLHCQGMNAALALLNATTPYRLTGVYRFDGDLVRSVVLFDRKNPDLR